MRTRQQIWAQKAYEKVISYKDQHKEEKEKIEKYATLCKSFPALLHSHGLCQALAFAEAKKYKDYLEHLEYILDEKQISDNSRNYDVTKYQKLSRDTLTAATWLKRYAEAFLDKEKK